MCMNRTHWPVFCPNIQYFIGTGKTSVRDTVEEILTFGYQIVIFVTYRSIFQQMTQTVQTRRL